MQKQKYGRIVNVASVGGIRGVLNRGPYVASKHAVSGMTKNAALEYGRDGINTHAIAPGAILTPAAAFLLSEDASSLLKDKPLLSMEKNRIYTAMSNSSKYINKL